MSIKFSNIFFFTGLILAASSASTSTAQTADWQNSEFEESGYHGMKVDKAYDEILKDKKPKEVIVAVIDGGTDPLHPDLKENIWVNKGEIPNNGKDDNSNGYIDDVHGWNYLDRIEYGNLELTRLVREYQKLYKETDPTLLSGSEKKEYEKYLSLEQELNTKEKLYTKSFLTYNKLSNAITSIEKLTKTDSITVDSLITLEISEPGLSASRDKLVSRMLTGKKDWKTVKKDIKKGYDYYLAKSKYHYNIKSDPRDDLGDNKNDYDQLGYGSNDVKGPEASHGTHVAGIIGAVRDNKIGVCGVAHHVKLMILRAVPNGDEHDKDVAHAIRYAVNNGAKVINMSFGKDYSPGKKYVDEAVKFAELKDVLIVHGSGNNSKNTDKYPRYPNKYYSDTKTTATNWIEVGSSSMSGKASTFSNYGKKGVDVFAPGEKINSTMPDGEYEKLNGTSMAAPGVSGVASLIRAYYPSLSASQVREIILNSVTIPDYKTNIPGTKKPVKFKKLCNSGGIANAYKALKLAETYTK
jgi:subtilisin family serine protease